MKTRGITSAIIETVYFEHCAVRNLTLTISFRRRNNSNKQCSVERIETSSSAPSLQKLEMQRNKHGSQEIQSWYTEIQYLEVSK